MAKQASLTGMAYRAIREEMLTCRLSPGSPLNVKKLSERYDVSLGAIREALSRLISEGFVLAEGRGFRSAPISVDELHDLTKVRIDIENRCLVSAMQAGGLEWESRIVAALHCLSKTPLLDVSDAKRLNENYAGAHAALHSALVSACDSPWLLRLRELLYAQSERYRYLAVPLVHEDRDVIAEHTEIANAVLARDAATATALMEKHLNRTANSLSAQPQIPASNRAVTSIANLAARPTVKAKLKPRPLVRKTRNAQAARSRDSLRRLREM
jgi:DNA-binding GntR family transcriptional regulator